MTPHEKINSLALGLLENSIVALKAKIEKALNSSGVDLDAWSPTNNPMILPKSILIAVLESEADEYKCDGTSFEKEVKRNVKALRYYI